MTTSSQIRQQYIEFFTQRHSHTFVASSPVVPLNDPTLLFTNAGMNQFKPYFLGTEKAPWTRVANTQKCIRAGGKHNDLDDVGRSRRHHTFFEMLGNWSFGDYFKPGAIEMAWELLTVVWKLDPKRLHVSCFEGDEKNGVPRDTEAADIWRRVANWEQYGLKSDDHIHYFGKDNFWEMGDTGPCGPCTEIYIDRRPQSEIDADRAAGRRSPVNGEDPRVMEIWNNVFIQFNRNADRSLSVLPSQHVDTGMGLERIIQVLQGKNDNFGIDLWEPIFAAISALSGHKYTGLFTATNSVDPVAEAANPQLRTDIAFRVIADHARCLTFALTDGAVPSNEGRGYVLRAILRRAARFGRQQLGLKEPFIYALVQPIVDEMGDTFPELRKNVGRVEALIKDEEVSFGKTLDRGISLFSTRAEDAILEVLRSTRPDLEIKATKYLTTRPSELDLPSDVKILDRKTGAVVSEASFKEIDVNFVKTFTSTTPVFPAEAAFQLHDTYGFPIGLTQVMASERGMTVDVEGFEKLMEQARELARSGGAVGGNAAESLVTIVQQQKLGATNFLGYETTELPSVETALLVFALKGDAYEATTSAPTGTPVAIVLDKTPFYGESGGQVGDKGVIQIHSGARVNVDDTIKVGDTFFHLGKVTSGSLTGGPAIKLALAVDRARRAAIAANHTTTHVMNHKLRDVLGEHIMQKGSLVDDQKLRFDFSHTAAVTTEQIEKIEQLVNADIAADLPVYIEYAPQQDALKIHGLRAVFGEKYPPKVRVVSVGVPVSDLLANPGNTSWYSNSVEFCGGTHLSKTGDAEGFAVISEEAVGKGLRRLTATTGHTAHKATADGDRLLSRVEALQGSDPEKLAHEIAELSQIIASSTLPLLARAKLRDGITELQKIVKEHEKSKAKEAAGDAVDSARKIADEAQGAFVVADVAGADADALRAAMDVIRKKKPDVAVLLGAVSGDKVSFVAAVPEAVIKKGLKAGDWVKEAAKIAGGGGGGRPDMAQAGGKDPAKLSEALDAARKFAATKLG